MEAGPIVVALFALVAIICLIPPIIWHIRYKNIPAICLILWFFLMNIKTFVNVLVWSEEDFYQKWNGKGYCDVMCKLEVGASSGKVAAIAALAMNLYMVLRAKNPIFMQPNSYKKIAIDLSICLITPIFTMAVNYVIQSSRYVIVRYQGCILTYDQSTKAIPLLWLWPFLWSLAALFFASMTIYSYFKKRKDVKDLLRCTNSNLNIRRFARLLIFSVLIILALIPLSIYFFVVNVMLIQRAKDFDQRGHKGDIYYYDLGMSQLYDKFITIGLSFITFLLFGLGSDALNMYKSFFRFKSRKDFKDFNNKGVKVLTDESDKSQSTLLTEFTNSSSMKDIHFEYADLMSTKETPESPFSLKKSAFHISTRDNDDPSEHSWSPSTLGDLELAAEVDEMINQDSFIYPDEGIGYNFQVKKK